MSIQVKISGFLNFRAIRNCLRLDLLDKAGQHSRGAILEISDYPFVGGSQTYFIPAFVRFDNRGGALNSDRHDRGRMSPSWIRSMFPRSSVMRFVGSPGIYIYHPGLSGSPAVERRGDVSDVIIRQVDSCRISGLPLRGHLGRSQLGRDQITYFESLRNATLLGRLRCSIESDIEGSHHGFIDYFMPKRGDLAEVGAPLLQMSVRWLREQWVSSIFAFVDSCDASMLNLLESIGFRKLSHRLVFAI